MPSQSPIHSHILSSLQLEQNSNLYIIQNLTFGDEIQRKRSDSFCLLSQNVDGLKLSNESFTLEEISDTIFRNEVDVACLSETNTNWKYPKSKYKTTKILRQFWSRIKLTTSETSTSCDTMYKPGGIVTITTTETFPRITTSGEDNESTGRWSYITIGGNKDHRVTIINAYRPCKQSPDIGISTTTTQQGDILEKFEQKPTDIRKKIINDLTKFINNLISKNNEIILLIDANEPLTPGSGIVRFYQNTNMIDPITLRNGYINITNTLQRGSQKIDFCFCIELINTFITKCAITSFNFFSSPDHRGIYLDILLKLFLHEIFKPVVTPSSRLLMTKEQTPCEYTNLDYSNTLQYKKSSNELKKIKKK